MASADSAQALPRSLTLVVRDTGEDIISVATLPSLGSHYQQGVDGHEYEVIVVGPTDEPPSWWADTSSGIRMRWVASEDPEHWLLRGANAAEGELVCFVGAPGVASPTLVACLLTAMDAHDTPRVSIASFLLPHGWEGDVRSWLAEHDWPKRPVALLRAANKHLEWLDPLTRPLNVTVRAEEARRLLAANPELTSSELLDKASGVPVQLVGAAFVRPTEPSSAPQTKRAAGDPRPVDPELRYVGFIHRPAHRTTNRPSRFQRRDRPRLSVIVIVHDMGREAPRTVQSLLPPYQHDVDHDEYEIVVVENGSSTPLDAAATCALGPNVSYHHLDDPPGSPAYAINYGVGQASGELIGVVIDGACMASPGVLAGAFLAARTFPLPIVGTRYFMLGPGRQRVTMHQGYDAAVEDRLLESIRWPADGYRLFEIASPLTLGQGGTTEHWFTTWFESNCLFFPRSVFDRLGGFDERFDFPGGGLLILDYFRQACELPDAQPIQLIGEGVFHQIHGGITTNTDEEDAARKLQAYTEQYEALRGRKRGAPEVNLHFLGRLVTPAARTKMLG